MIGLILFVAALVLCIVLSTKFKLNMGVLGIIFAFIFAIALKKSPSSVVNSFNGGLFTNMFLACFFFGFANSNGTMNKMAGWLMYWFRNARWAMPVVLYITSLALSLAGAGTDATPIIMSPIAYSLAQALGFNPLLGVICTALGAVSGTQALWTSNAATWGGVISNVFGEAFTTAWQFKAMFIHILYGLIWFAVLFVVLRGWKFAGRKEGISIDAAKPEPFNREQKISIQLIMWLIAIIIIPNIFHAIAPNPVTTWLTTYLKVNVLCSIGIILNCIFKTADEKDVLKNKIPFNGIITVCGMGMLMGFVSDLGIMDMLVSWLQGGVPQWLVITIFVSVTAFLSMFVSGRTLLVFFVEIIPALTLATGITETSFLLMLDAGLVATSISPFSMGGSFHMSDITDEPTREYIIPRLMGCAILLWVVSIIMGVLGIFTAWG